MTRTCLDLFSGLGGFSSAFADHSNWNVTTIDVNPEFDPDICADVTELHKTSITNREYDLVLASPPCVDFSVACIVNKWSHDENRRPKHLPRKPQIADSIAVVFHTLHLAYELSPRYWFLENPQGMLSKWIGEPTGSVNYCQYGSEFKKPTQLWGNHPPMKYRMCPGRSVCGHVANPNESNTFRDKTRSTEAVLASAERAKVPYELSESIRDAVERAFENPPCKQQTLPVGESV